VDLALIRDVLDTQLIDRDGEPMGRVDGIIMSWHPDAAPRITHLELGGVTLARRLPRRLRGAADWLARRLSPRNGDPHRIEVARIVRLGKRIELDLDASRSAAHASERWVRDHIVTRIPGS